MKPGGSAWLAEVGSKAAVRLLLNTEHAERVGPNVGRKVCAHCQATPPIGA